jgi:hypothetical protein
MKKYLYNKKSKKVIKKNERITVIKVLDTISQKQKRNISSEKVVVQNNLE